MRKSQQSRRARLERFQAALNIEEARRQAERASPADRVHFDAVLIDSDPAVRELWRLSAEASGKTILIFTRFVESGSVLSTLARTVPVYLDDYLPDNEIAQAIFCLRSLGFQRLYITSRHGLTSNAMAFQMRAYGKIPPWPILSGT